MKRCPTCNKTYTEENLSFCIDDGTPLIAESPSNDRTVAAPRFGDDRQTHDRADDWNASAYQPPSYVPPPGTTRERKVWPWVVGILGVLVLGFVGLAIAVAVILPRMIRSAQDTRGTPPPVAEYNNNSSSNSNSESNANINSAKTNTDKTTNANSLAPTDNDLVLAQLTNLEHEWTVANINADKKALNRILADDYAGADGSGQIQGKADYLKNISRDTSIQKWDFKNLKVTLHGDRATLGGTLILRRQNQDSSFNFIDKFVWRDGRWQATGSVVTPIQQTL